MGGRQLSACSPLLGLILGVRLAGAAPPPPDRFELGLVPALAFDSDTGVGFGAVGSLVRFTANEDPYAWRALAQVFMTARRAPEGGVELPFHDHMLGLEVPAWFGGGVRPGLRLGYGRFTAAGYYGLGNAARLDAAALANHPRYHAYTRQQAWGQPELRLPLARPGGKLDLLLGGRVAHLTTDLYAASRLAADAGGAAGSRTTRLLVGLADHVQLEGSAGVLFDDRDHETTPTRGQLHELVLRAGGGVAGERFGYTGLRATGRLFVPLPGGLGVVAGRLLGEALFGQPPLYELALGGGTTIRGARGQRLHGKLKLLGNLELRAMPLAFTLFAERFRLGGLLFVDSGRVFADLGPTRLDGSGLGLTTGLGGGLRWQWGEHFLLRADVAYAFPDETLGVYVDVSHIF